MTKAQKTERAEAIAQLRDWIKPGDTVYTILRKVSRSGMQREISVVIPSVQDDGRVDFLHPNWAISKALGLRQGKSDGLIVGGCGMDMGFHLVYELSQTLYGRRQCTQCRVWLPYDYPTNVTCGKCDGEIEGGYACLGQGRCPSNYHTNYRRQAHTDPERWDLIHTDGYAVRHRWL